MQRKIVLFTDEVTHDAAFKQSNNALTLSVFIILGLVEKKIRLNLHSSCDCFQSFVFYGESEPIVLVFIFCYDIYILSQRWMLIFSRAKEGDLEILDLHNIRAETSDLDYTL